ncbi:MAG: sialidase family protein [Gaiellaceae bacterium]
MRLLLVAALAVGATVVAVLLPQSAGSASREPGNKIYAAELSLMRGNTPRVTRGRRTMPLSSGVAYTLLQAYGLEPRGPSRPGTMKFPPAPSTSGCQNVYSGGAGQIGPNIRINQDCSFRRQAEEVVVANPRHPQNLIAGQNDSRIGFNHCGYDWSMNGGETWGDQIPPFWGYILPGGVTDVPSTADACSDPTVAFDAQGNAYAGGVIFDVFSGASAIVATKSLFPLGGSFWHSPLQRPFQIYRTDPLGVPAADDSECIAHDKEFLVGDSNPGSPKANNVYATWTRFTCEDSPIVFSQSTDGGATWSAPVEINGANAAFCTHFGSPAGSCDQSQGSHPIVGHDGVVYVAFGNGNTPDYGINQVLFVRCPMVGQPVSGTDCSNQANWSGPSRVADLIETHPIGPSPSGCPPGRQCIPPNGYRAPMVTSITASVDNAGRLYVSWADTRNIGPNCHYTNPSPTPPCNSDVFYAWSTNGGTSWSPARNLTPPPGFGQTAQWQPWSDVTHDGSALIVAFYDRSNGDCESSGCNDITLAGVRNPAQAGAPVGYRRVTTSSMPNLTPANNPVQAGFLGDYMWVDVDNQRRAHIAWADTRGLNGQVEEDVYYASVSVP